MKANFILHYLSIVFEEKIMTRLFLLVLAVSLVFSQSAYAQTSIRLGGSGSKVVSSDALFTSDFEIGYAAMAGMESPLSPVASILLEVGYISNKVTSFEGFVVPVDAAQSVLLANVGIKLNSPSLYLVGVIGYNQSKRSIASGGVAVTSTYNDIGAGAGVGINLGSLFSEVRLYHSKAAQGTYLLGIVGIQIP